MAVYTVTITIDEGNAPGFKEAAQAAFEDIFIHLDSILMEVEDQDTGEIEFVVVDRYGDIV